MAYNNFPPVNKIFDDLDKFRDFCRFENRGYPFDEAALYNDKHPVWQAYKKHQGWLRAKARNAGRNITTRKN
jgi:hypothetical protein